jgi:hypothetical protein
MQYLTFIEGSDSSAITSVEKLTNGNLIAVHAKNASDDKVVGFSSNANGTAIVLPVSYSFTAAGPTDTHLIANLAPNATVNVARSKTAGVVSVTLALIGGGTNYTTTPNGVLCFTSSGTPCTSGQTSAPPPPPPTNPNSCDLNGDGVVNVLDVQIAINQALGVSPCNTADLLGTGVCNVIDVQRVTNAAAGQACKVGQ